MKKVVIKRINLKSFIKAVLLSITLPVVMVVVINLIIGVFFFLFVSSPASTGGLGVTMLQLFWMMFPYVLGLFSTIVFIIFCVISYNYFAPKVGGLELDVENDSVIETTQVLH